MHDIEFRNVVKNGSGLSNVHWGLMPDNSDYPGITLNIISNIYDYSQDGIDKIHSATVQVDVWSKTYSEAFEIKEDVIRHLASFKGAEKLISVFVLAVRQSVDTSSETKLHRFSIDVDIFYEM